MARRKPKSTEIVKLELTVSKDFAQEIKDDWSDRLLALGSFLHAQFPEEKVLICAFEDENIGGLRISEISFTRETKTGMVGGSYMRGDLDARGMILSCEVFCATYGVEPYLPAGWETHINEHGDARLAILNAMGIDRDAERRSQQIEEAQLLAKKEG